MKKYETKILATLGPATTDAVSIARLIEAGANGFRINMSYSDADDLKATATMIRQVATDLGEPIAIVADLCGPKIRVAPIPDGAKELVPGARLFLGSDIPLTLPDVLKDVKPGQRILLDDGKLEVTAVSTGSGLVEVLV
ncbi:MAG: pyruvate kinase, partial [Lentisphaerae bacterium]|nr:pyruvate kinase [Lentisphaerota bacterium]